jgi:hypothetical protein
MPRGLESSRTKCLDHLGHNCNGDLGGASGTDIKADRRMNQSDLILAEPQRLEPLNTLCMGLAATQRADVKASRF